MRHWTCSDCGALHDRDVNAARNLLFAGAERRPPVEEIPSLYGGEDVKELSGDVSPVAASLARAITFGIGKIAGSFKLRPAA